MNILRANGTRFHLIVSPQAEAQQKGGTASCRPQNEGVMAECSPYDLRPSGPTGGAFAPHKRFHRGWKPWRRKNLLCLSIWISHDIQREGHAFQRVPLFGWGGEIDIFKGRQNRCKAADPNRSPAQQVRFGSAARQNERAIGWKGRLKSISP